MRIETRAAALHCGTVSRRVRAAALCTGGICVRAAALYRAVCVPPQYVPPPHCEPAACVCVPPHCVSPPHWRRTVLLCRAVCVPPHYVALWHCVAPRACRRTLHRRLMRACRRTVYRRRTVFQLLCLG